MVVAEGERPGLGGAIDVRLPVDVRDTASLPGDQDGTEPGRAVAHVALELGDLLGRERSGLLHGAPPMGSGCEMDVDAPAAPRRWRGPLTHPGDRAGPQRQGLIRQTYSMR